MKLHLGVIDAPHGTEGGLTTGGLAEILEEKYHPFRHYVELHGQEIADALANAVAGQIENMAMGAPVSGDPLAAGIGPIEEGFRRMIESKELESLGYPGLPTGAAKKGRSLRFKGKKNPKGRPSLIDTGQYVASAKAWVEGDL